MRVYDRADVKFFDELVAYLASMTSLGILMSTHLFGFEKAGYKEDFRLILAGMSGVTGINLVFYPFSLMQTLARDGWPDRLEMEETSTPELRSPESVTLHGISGVQTLLMEGVFLRYFESNLHVIKANHGNNLGAWPTVWNFARVLRNACAHGGTIHFRNASASPVTWRSLTYGPGDNGKQVFFTDLAVVELIEIMGDMDSHL